MENTPSWHRPFVLFLCLNRERKMRNWFLFLLTLFVGVSVAQAGFLPPDKAFVFDHQQQGNRLELNWQIADGYYLYQDRIHATDAQGNALTSLTLDRDGEAKQDPNFGLVHVYHHQLAATLANASGDVTIQYQGCAEDGLCYPPQKRVLTLADQPTSAVTTSVSTTSVPTASMPTASMPTAPASVNYEDAGQISALLANANGIWVLLTFLALGLGLTFTPCVLPMIPILAGIIAGQSGKLTTRSGFALSTAYVLGMALTYTLAGMLVAYFGARMNLASALQSPTALTLFASLFLLLSLSMFGLFELQLPSFIAEPLNRMGEKKVGGRYLSVAIMGAVSALVVSPCVSAPLAGALIYISTTGDALFGGAALFALSMGMGLPLILVGTGGGKWLPKAGNWMLEVKTLFGVMLVGVAISLLSRLLPGYISLLLWSALLILYAAHLGLQSQNAQVSGFASLKKGGATLMMVYGVSLMVGGLAGQTDPFRPLGFLQVTSAQGEAGTSAQASQFVRVQSVQDLDRALVNAQQQQMPVVLDLYADWCASCQVMEKEIFHQPAVTQLNGQVIFLQLDITRNSDDQVNFLQQHGLFGPPGILFFDRQGQEDPAQRLLGETTLNEFLSRTRRLL